MKYQHLFSAGHHFFKCVATGRIAIADNSMRDFTNPESTDDGLLYVDTMLPLRLERSGYLSIPLRDPKGELTNTVTSRESASWLMEDRHMHLVIDGIGPVQVIRVKDVNPSGRAGSSQWAICR